MHKQNGFTLIEIAIVLVIIGLLLGGVLKGQELIGSAKVKAMAGDFRNMPALIYGYQDKFRALPGDDAAAKMHLGTAATQLAGSVGNGRIDGAWDSLSAGDESFILWEHLRLSGLAAGPLRHDDPTYLPKNPEGGSIGIESLQQSGGAYVSGLGGTYLLCSAGISGKLARLLDIALDDGSGASGQLRIVDASHVRNSGPGIDNASDPASIADAGRYTVCLGF